MDIILCTHNTNKINLNILKHHKICKSLVILIKDKARMPYVLNSCMNSAPDKFKQTLQGQVELYITGETIYVSFVPFIFNQLYDYIFEGILEECLLLIIILYPDYIYSK